MEFFLFVVCFGGVALFSSSSSKESSCVCNVCLPNPIFIGIAAFMGVFFIGVLFTGFDIGVDFMGVFFIGVDFMGVLFIVVFFMGVLCTSREESEPEEDEPEPEGVGVASPEASPEELEEEPEEPEELEEEPEEELDLACFFAHRHGFRFLFGSFFGR